MNGIIANTDFSKGHVSSKAKSENTSNPMAYGPPLMLFLSWPNPSNEQKRLTRNALLTASRLCDLSDLPQVGPRSEEKPRKWLDGLKVFHFKGKLLQGKSPHWTNVIVFHPRNTFSAPILPAHKKTVSRAKDHFEKKHLATNCAIRYQVLQSHKQQQNPLATLYSWYSTIPPLFGYGSKEVYIPFKNWKNQQKLQFRRPNTFCAIAIFAKCHSCLKLRHHRLSELLLLSSIFTRRSKLLVQLLG